MADLFFKEWFQCPECAHRNNIEWGGTDTQMMIDCVSCRRSVDVDRVFDEDGNLLFEADGTTPQSTPSAMCTCTPKVNAPHFEGARFLCVKYAGSVVPNMTGGGLTALKVVRTQQVNGQVSAFIQAAYGRNQQMSLNALLTKGALTQNMPLAAYVSQALAWVEAVIKLYYPLRDAILAATTPEDVMAVTFDGGLAPPDPVVTIEHALTLTD